MNIPIAERFSLRPEVYAGASLGAFAFRLEGQNLGYPVAAAPTLSAGLTFAYTLKPALRLFARLLYGQALTTPQHPLISPYGPQELGLEIGVLWGQFVTEQ